MQGWSVGVPPAVSGLAAGQAATASSPVGPIQWHREAMLRGSHSGSDAGLSFTDLHLYHLFEASVAMQVVAGYFAAVATTTAAEAVTWQTHLAHGLGRTAAVVSSLATGVSTGCSTIQWSYAEGAFLGQMVFGVDFEIASTVQASSDIDSTCPILVWNLVLHLQRLVVGRMKRCRRGRWLAAVAGGLKVVAAQLPCAAGLAGAVPDSVYRHNHQRQEDLQFATMQNLTRQTLH